MIRRSIAAVVLAALCWLSVPVAFALPQMNTLQAAEHNATSHEDDCCPQIRSKFTPVLFVANFAPAMPCGEQHPCCARRVPSNPTTLPVETKVIRPATEQSLATQFHEIFPDRGRTAEISTVSFLSPPFERSTVLRN